MQRRTELPEDVEAWADALIEQHGGRPRSAGGGRGLASLDGWWAERRARAIERHRRASALDSTVQLIAAVMLLVGGLVWLGMF